VRPREHPLDIGFREQVAFLECAEDLPPKSLLDETQVLGPGDRDALKTTVGAQYAVGGDQVGVGVVGQVGVEGLGDRDDAGLQLRMLGDLGDLSDLSEEPGQDPGGGAGQLA